MSTGAALLAVLGVGAITYLWRAGMVLVLADRVLPRPLIQALSNVGPAVMAALVVTMAAGSEGASGITVPEVLAVLVGGLVAAKTRSLIWATLAGMSVLWITGLL